MKFLPVRILHQKRKVNTLPVNLTLGVGPKHLGGGQEKHCFVLGG